MTRISRFDLAGCIALAAALHGGAAVGFVAWRTDDPPEPPPVFQLELAALGDDFGDLGPSDPAADMSAPRSREDPLAAADEPDMADLPEIPPPPEAPADEPPPLEELPELDEPPPPPEPEAVEAPPLEPPPPPDPPVDEPPPPDPPADEPPPPEEAAPLEVAELPPPPPPPPPAPAREPEPEVEPRDPLAELPPPRRKPRPPRPQAAETPPPAARPPAPAQTAAVAAPPRAAVAPARNPAAVRAYTEGLHARLNRAAQRSYPTRSIDRGEEGVVPVLLTIGRDGKLLQVRVLDDTLAADRLVKAAVKAIQKSAPFPQFAADMGGEPTKFTVRINYSLR